MTHRLFALLLTLATLLPLPALARDMVPFQGHEPGTIVVATGIRAVIIALCAR
jgi:hypothetical protein